MIRTVSILAIALAWGTPISAQDTVLWKRVGNWDVSIDTTVGNGCFTTSTWNGGTFMRIGLNPEADNFYFLVGNDKWASITPDQEYDIQIKFGNKAAWDVSAIGFQFNPGELTYLLARSTKYDFIEEFMRQSNMRISYDGREIDNLKLTGSSRAFKTVIACQEEADRRSANSDPFAGTSKPATAPKTGRKSEDPFANN